MWRNECSGTGWSWLEMVAMRQGVEEVVRCRVEASFLSTA